MYLGIKRNLVDLIDLIYLRVSRRKNIPPYSFRAYVGPIDEFERVPQEYIAYFKLLCGLRMDQTILDIGCGPGRFASQLLCSPNFFHGEYYGFDINKRMIGWANSNIASHHRNCHFECVELMNSLYWPNGKLSAENFSFPYPIEKFDFVFAVSVLTHLLPAACNNYLNEISRVLKSEGKALVSLLLINEPQEDLSPIAKEHWKDLLKYVCEGTGTWHHVDNTYSVLYPPKPEAAVAYQKHAIEEMVNQTGLSIDNIHYGAWSGREEYLSFQDLLILHKR